jgi:carbamoyltransferase
LGQLAFSDQFYRRLKSPRPAEGPIEESVRANLAASVQSACTTVVLEILDRLRQETGAKNLCLAGGLFLNPLIVAAVEKQAGFAEVFVQPAAGNEGTALGAAWLAWHSVKKKPRVAPALRLDWGPSFSNEEIKQVLDNCKASYRWTDPDDNKIAAAIGLLEAGKIVAWFQGAAEFGPRALGNRSLLASPWAPYVKENLNDFVKHRESYRPFALSIPEEDAPRFFECSPAGRFMATMGYVRAEHRETFRDFLLPGGQLRLHLVAAIRQSAAVEAAEALWRDFSRAGSGEYVV